MSTSNCCWRCKKPLDSSSVRPGPKLGRMHQECFNAWDREQEALEWSFALAVSLPPEDEVVLHDQSLSAAA